MHPAILNELQVLSSLNFLQISDPFLVPSPSVSVLNGSTFDVSFEALHREMTGEKSKNDDVNNKSATLQSADLQIQIDEENRQKEGIGIKFRRCLRRIFVKDKQARTIKTG